MMRTVADALLPLLLSATVRGTVLLLVAMGAAWMLRARSAALRHAVWSAALAGILLVPPLTQAPGLPAVNAPVSALPGFAANRPLALRAPWERVAEPRTPGVAATAAGVRVRGPESPRVSDAAVLLWLLVAALGLACEAVGQVRARRLAARAAAPASPCLREAMVQAAREMGVRRAVPLRLSAEVAGPVSMGVARPVVLLQADAAEWPMERLRPALLHELAHVARRDGLTDLLGRLARALLWFHPLAWTALRRMRGERERACDDRVLAARVHPAGYAALLLEVARTARRAPHGALAMAQRMSEFEGRVRAVLDPSVRRRPPSRAAWCGLAAAAVLSVAACASVRLQAAAAPAQAVSATATAPRPSVAAAPEPDQAGDSVSHPSSERIPGHAARMPAALAAWRAALAGPDSAWAARLIAGLAEEPAGPADLVRERAAWALARAEDGRLMEPMLRALADADWRVRAYAGWALGQSGDARAVRPLLPLLEHPVWRVRAAGAFALAQLGGAAAEPAMRRALHDPAWQVRTGAVELIGTLQSADRVPLLRARVADRHPVVRDAAATALARAPS